jgi:hypothetical protein
MHSRGTRPANLNLFYKCSLWCRQSQQSFNTLTPFYFLCHSLHVSAPTNWIKIVKSSKFSVKTGPVYKMLKYREEWAFVSPHGGLGGTLRFVACQSISVVVIELWAMEAFCLSHVIACLFFVASVLSVLEMLIPLDILTFYIWDLFLRRILMILQFLFNLITCIRTISQSTDIQHITSLHQIAYVQRIHCIKNSP